jgi:hypothetical protein
MVEDGGFDQLSLSSPLMNMFGNMDGFSLMKGGQKFCASFISIWKLKMGKESHGKQIEILKISTL